MNRVRKLNTIASVTLAMSVGLFAGSVISQSDAGSKTSTETTSCYSKKQWQLFTAAPAGKRPCYTITRPTRDGDGHMWLHGANPRKWTWYCRIPKPTKEPYPLERQMEIVCTKAGS